uniref:Olfactory receptor n=1 Tax=Gopherus evgoodei TaxID=1825980 RepID=A0A8C4W2V7_9SAUR
MAGDNGTPLTEFILVGFTDNPSLQVIYFLLFLVIYVITLVGNLGMIILIRISSRLHTPMYFFLCNLSVVDICYSSVVTPKMLANFLAQSKAISYSGCLVQLYFFIIWLSTECLLLAVMAYDRYVAICKPLLYSAVMSHKVCLVSGLYLIGFVHALAQTISTFRLSFCSSNVINHYFCDILPLIQLSCSDAYSNEIVLCTFGTFHGIITSLKILVSYIYIISTILRIRSTRGRRKAFSTCAFHLTAVMIFYGTTVFMYVRPISMFYTVVIPMLNPLIYNLRNKEVEDALKRLLDQITVS